MSSSPRTWIDYSLWILLAIGFIGALNISYDNLTGRPCPHLLMVPVCYVVLGGYSLMVLSVIISNSGCRHHFFVTGWSIATVVALFGSLAELIAGGGVCPASGGGSIRGATASSGVPLCYVSLALLIGILLLFILGPYKRACNLTRDSEA